jgi:hypothetical protein
LRFRPFADLLIFLSNFPAAKPLPAPSAPYDLLDLRRRKEHAAISAQVPQLDRFGKKSAGLVISTPWGHAFRLPLSAVGRGTSTRPADRAHGRGGERRLPPPGGWSARSQSVINGKPPPRAGLRTCVCRELSRRRLGSGRARTVPRRDLGGVPFKPFSPLALSPGVGCDGNGLLRSNGPRPSGARNPGQRSLRHHRTGQSRQ